MDHGRTGTGQQKCSIVLGLVEVSVYVCNVCHLYSDKGWHASHTGMMMLFAHADVHLHSTEAQQGAAAAHNTK